MTAVTCAALAKGAHDLHERANRDPWPSAPPMVDSTRILMKSRGFEWSCPSKPRQGGPVKPEGEFVRVTQCPECKAQYRLKDAQADLAAGQTASCRKCRARFVVVVSVIPDPVPLQSAQDAAPAAPVSADPTDGAAEGTAEGAGEMARRLQRRSRAEVRADNVKQIRDSFSTLHTRLREINSMPESSEEDVRRWVLDALRHGLGHEDKNIRTEERANERRVDITLRLVPSGSPTIVFEVKPIRRSLSRRVIDQASSYAAVLNCPYAVVTNGDAWILLRSVIGPEGRQRLIEIFNIALLDEDGVSEEDAEALYLLTHKSLSSGFTERQSHHIAALQPRRIWNALQDPGTLAKVRRTICEQYKEEAGVPVEIDSADLLDHIEGLLVPDDL